MLKVFSKIEESAKIKPFWHFKKMRKKNPKYLIVELQKDNNYRNYSPKLIEKLINELGYVKIFEKNGPLNLFKDCVYQILKK